jgi:hypothetical protein
MQNKKSHDSMCFGYMCKVWQVGFGGAFGLKDLKLIMECKKQLQFLLKSRILVASR